MARGIALRMLQARQPVQIVGRNKIQTDELVEALGAGATGAAEDAQVEGSIVFLAVPFAEAKKVVARSAESFKGKVLVDISNPVDPATFDRLTVAPGSSAAEEIAALAPDAEVVKAFNTCFASTLEKGTVAGVPLDVFLAGDSETAKRKVSALVAGSGLRPIDVGPLRRARELEAIMLLIMGLQVNPEHRTFNWDTALKLLP